MEEWGGGGGGGAMPKTRGHATVSELGHTPLERDISVQ